MIPNRACLGPDPPLSVYLEVRLVMDTEGGTGFGVEVTEAFDLQCPLQGTGRWGYLWPSVSPST